MMGDGEQIPFFFIKLGQNHLSRQYFIFYVVLFLESEPIDECINFTEMCFRKKIVVSVQ